MSKQSSCAKKTTIGGQAIIEGIMMRGPHKTSYVVRKNNGETVMKLENNKSLSKKYPILGWPLIRGTINLGTSLAVGMRALDYSASFFEDETQEPSKFDKWLQKVLGEKLQSVLIGFSMVAGIGLAILLFFILPTVLAGFATSVIQSQFGRSLFEGLMRILILLAYLWLVTRIPDIKQVFRYHGAEHKTIACYEHGAELTPENARTFSRFHPRCGTSFLLIVMIVSILVFSFLTWDSLLERILLRILLLPVVIGISYELIRFAGRTDSWVGKALSAPGLWLQRLTTAEPDDGMLEVAIQAIQAVLPEQEGEDNW